MTPRREAEHQYVALPMRPGVVAERVRLRRGFATVAPPKWRSKMVGGKEEVARDARMVHDVDDERRGHTDMLAVLRHFARDFLGHRVCPIPIHKEGKRYRRKG